MPIDTFKTGAAIAAHRQLKELSQQGLAGLMNVTHQAVSKWEKGQALPDTETLLALAKLFGVSMESLLAGEPPVQEEKPETVPEETPEDPIPEVPSVDFNTLLDLLPFVSSQTADRLFNAYVSTEQPDVHQISRIAPFVSTKALNGFILAHPITECNPQVLRRLAPFLPTATVDQLILGLTETPSPQLMRKLAPFASSKVVDEIVLGHFDALEKHISDSVEKSVPAALQQTQGPRESPRMRLARKAVEDRNDPWLCKHAGELDSDELRTLCLLLLEKKMYGPLESLIHEGIDTETQHILLDIAIETNNQQLMDMLSESL